MKYEYMRTAVKGFFIRSSRVKVITINSDLPETVRRFILAHELGHAVLHGNSGCSTFHDVTLYDDSSATEKEANLFAAELLMNDEDVLTMINHDGTFFSAAAVLGVPMELLDFKLTAGRVAQRFSEGNSDSGKPR